MTNVKNANLIIKLLHLLEKNKCKVKFEIQKLEDGDTVACIQMIQYILFEFNNNIKSICQMSGMEYYNYNITKFSISLYQCIVL